MGKKHRNKPRQDQPKYNRNSFMFNERFLENWVTLLKGAYQNYEQHFGKNIHCYHTIEDDIPIIIANRNIAHILGLERNGLKSILEEIDSKKYLHLVGHSSGDEDDYLYDYLACEIDYLALIRKCHDFLRLNDLEPANIDFIARKIYADDTFTDKGRLQADVAIKFLNPNMVLALRKTNNRYVTVSNMPFSQIDYNNYLSDKQLLIPHGYYQGDLDNIVCSLSHAKNQLISEDLLIAFEQRYNKYCNNYGAIIDRTDSFYHYICPLEPEEELTLEDIDNKIKVRI